MPQGVTLKNTIGVLKRTLTQRYQELEEASKDGLPPHEFLQDVATGLFAQLAKRYSPKNGISNVKYFRAAAMEVARRIEADNSAWNNAYHNPLHFAKVATNFFVLADLHNQMVKSGKIKQPLLETSDIAAGIFLGIAHDFGHDGKGNSPGGVHTPFRLERQSINQVTDILNNLPILQHYSDRGVVADSFQLILATIVSRPAPGAPSPALIIRAAYDHYFGKAVHAKPVLSGVDGLSGIVANPKRTLLAALLVDADILTLAMGGPQFEKEDTRVSAEAGRPNTSGKKYFLETILAGRLTTTVAEMLAGKTVRQNLRRLNPAPAPA